MWNALTEYVRSTSTIDEWKKIAYDFLEFWDTSNCFSALDGKHVGMWKSALSRSLWHSFSMLLLEICDTPFEFNFVDVAEYGSNKDSRILKNSPSKNLLINLLIFVFLNALEDVPDILLASLLLCSDIFISQFRNGFSAGSPERVL